MASYSWHWFFPVGPEALWPRISDTDWVNRHAGLPPVRYRYEPLATGGSRTHAEISLGPLKIRWIEPPFEWSEPEYYAIERLYESGPLKRFHSRTSLTAEGNGTRIDLDVQLEARSPLFDWILPLVAAYGKRGADRAFHAAANYTMHPDAENRDTVPALFARRQLREVGFADPLLDKLAAFLETAEDRDLAKIRAYELADRWNEPRKTVLHLFLTAVRFGLLNLSWDVMCQSCRGTKQSAGTLDKVTAQVHCDGCNVTFGPQFDRSVEVTFNAHPLGKGIDVPAYCLAGPHMSRHVAGQRGVKPGGTSALDVTVKPGRYVAHAMNVTQLPFAVEADERPATLPVAITAAGQIEGIAPAVAAAELRLELHNALDRAVLLRIEESEWPDTIVTAADVTALQEFRDLFSSEILTSGLELSIQSMTVLFTDLVGSTALYSNSGDAPAFRIVTEHFEKMRPIIAEYDGAIVKTIGDAIMAVFRDSGKCLEAALRLPQAVGMVECEGQRLRLRVGFHSGPCITMSANGRLDYFGTTVNLASRLEHAAGAGEVVFTATTAAFPHMQAVLKNYNLRPVPEELPIKGFTHAIKLQRINAF